MFHRSPTARRLSLLAAGGALVVVLAGCGRGEGPATGSSDLEIDDSPATGTVTLWAPDGDAGTLEDVLAPFEDENPDLDVEITLVPSDEYNTRLQTALAAGTTPDIAFLYTEAQAQFTATGAFQAVPGDVVDAQSFFEGAWESGRVDDTVYSVPWYAYTRALVYRSDFAEAGGVEAPETWDDWLPFLRGLEAGGAEMGLGADVGWDTYTGQTISTYTAQAGGALLDEGTGEWAIDSPEAIAAAEFFIEPFTEGIASVDSPQFLDAQPYFVQGRTGAMLTGPWVIPALDEVAEEDGWTAEHVATAPMPADATGVGSLGGGSLGVIDGTENAESAWKVIRYLAQPEAQLAQHAAYGSMPAVAAAWEDESIAGQPLLDAFFEQISDVELMPATRTWSEVSTVIGRELEAAARGNRTVEDAMTAAQEQAASIGTGD